MPEVEPIPLMTETDKLNLKREVIRFANRNNMQYRDFGSWVALVIPTYKVPTEEGGENAKARPAKH